MQKDIDLNKINLVHILISLVRVSTETNQQEKTRD